MVVEDRKADADTHLADARSQNTGNGILGDKQKRRAVAKATAYFFSEDKSEEDEYERSSKKIN